MAALTQHLPEPGSTNVQIRSVLGLFLDGLQPYIDNILPQNDQTNHYALENIRIPTQQLYDRTSCVLSVRRMTNTVENRKKVDSCSVVPAITLEIRK